MEINFLYLFFKYISLVFFLMLSTCSGNYELADTDTTLLEGVVVKADTTYNNCEETIVFDQEIPEPPQPATLGKNVIVIDEDTDLKIENLKRLIKFDFPDNYSDYNVDVYDGTLSPPDFKGNEFAEDTEYVKFITDGCEKNGINFGGHYTVVERSCGAMCGHIFIIDRINGKIFTDINPDDGRWGYMYKKDSRLLVANSEMFVDKNFEYYEDNSFGKPELYVWNGENFKLLE